VSTAAAKGPYVIDEFDAYTRVFREVRVWRWTSAGLAVVALFLVGLVVIQALQPPVVIVKDRTSTDPPTLAHPGDKPAVTATDAENFFLYVLRRRYGWESPTVMRDLDELHPLMTKEMGAAFAAFVNEPVAAPSARGQPADPEKRVPRVLSWMQTLVHNQVVLDRSAVDCRKGEPVNGVEQWYCRAFGVIETSLLGKPLGEAAAKRQRVEFRARFQPLPYDKRGVRLWGLGIAYLDTLDVTDTP
jgi:hypothetical protein